MATLILGGIGAAIGSTLGPGGALKGFEIGATIGGMIDAANRPGVHQEVGRLADLRVSGSSYGTIIPQVWGAVRVPGIVIWSTDKIEHQKNVSAGGKGIGGGPTSTTYTYTVSFACAIARGGRNIQIKRIWADDLILWDSSAPNTSINFRVYQGSETQPVDPLIVSLLPKTPAYRGMCYVVFQDLQITANFNNAIPNLSFEITTDPVTAANVMSDIAAQTPLKTTDIDVSQATTPIPGYLLATRAAAKDAMAQILTMFLYDNVETDGVLRLKGRGSLPIAQIGIDEIGAVLEAGTGGNDDVQGIATTIAQEIELPQFLEVVYFSAAKYFEQLTQRAIKQTAKTPNIVTMSTGLTLDDTQALQMAYVLLYNTWLERTSFQFSTLPKYRYLTVGDVIQVPIGSDNTLTRMRITAVQLGMPGEVRLTCLLDAAGLLSQLLTGTVGTVVNAPPPMYGVPVPSDFYTWSGRELQDADQASAGFYVAANGGPGWAGGEIWYSTDSGTTYHDGGRISTGAIIANCTSTLPAYSGAAGAEDTASTLSVQTLDGSILTSTSVAAAQLGDNAAIVGGEILTFASAALSGPGAYMLSGFFRGERGSPVTHAAGETLVMGTSAIARVSLPANLVGQQVLVKVVSNFQQLSDVAAKSVTIAARTPTSIEQSITSLSDSIPRPAPFYRVRGYINSGRGQGDHIDATYFSGGANVPAGTVQFAYTEYAAGPGGSVSKSTNLNAALWYRIGLKNPSTAAVTVNFFIPFVDNYTGITWNGTSIFSKATSDGSLSNNAGTFSVAAGQSGELDLFFFNEQSNFIDNGNNPAAFWVMLDALDNGVLTFYDLGA